MEGEELQVVPGFSIEPLPQLWIEGFTGIFGGDEDIPPLRSGLHLQLVDSACEESANEKEFLIPNWGIV